MKTIIAKFLNLFSFCVDHKPCIERESELTEIITNIIDDFNKESENLKEQVHECHNENNSLKNEIVIMNNILMLKDDEIFTLNNKLNTYTMDNFQVMEKLNACVYQLNNDDITISNSDIISISELNLILSKFNANALTIIDKEYYTIEKDDVAKLLALNNNIDKSSYILDKENCDDFAFAIKGMFSQEGLNSFVFGWARSSNHAFNFFIDRHYTVWIVEPKNSTIMKYSDLIKDQIQNFKNQTDVDYRITTFLI